MSKTAPIEYQFTPVPSETLERLAAAGLTGREFRIVLVVWRKTWGWSKEKDKIPMSQFARLTGIDRRKCHVLLTGLVDKKIIKKSVAVKGDRKTITYSFNDIYSEWQVLPSRGTKVKRETVPLWGDSVSPSTATVLSPSTAHSIDNNKNLLKESSVTPSGLLDDQGAPPSEHEGLESMNDILTRTGSVDRMSQRDDQAAREAFEAIRRI